MQFYRQTLKKAWSLTIQNPFLWFFGLFAALAGNGEEYDTFFNNLRLVQNTQTNLDEYRTALLNGEIGTFFENLGLTFKTDLGTALLLIVAGAIILLVLAWLMTVSQAALITTANRKEDGEKTGFIDALLTGSKFYWKLFGLNALAMGVIYLALGLIALPLVALYIPNASMTWSVLLTLLAFILLIPINVVTSFITKYAAIYIVTQGNKILPAIVNAWRLFKKNWLISLELGILLLIINVAYTVLLISVLAMLSLPFSRAGLVAMTAIVVIAGSIYSAFRYSAWTFLFRDIIEDRGISKLVRLFQSKSAEK